MKTTCAVILSVVLLLCPACTPKMNDPADVQAVKKSFEDFVKAVNAGDAAAAASLMTDKTVYADLNAPVAVGADAIRSFWQAVFGQFKVDFIAQAEDVRVAGDLAIARGTWAVKLTPKAEGIATLSDTGSWVVSWTRQRDGAWKWDWCVPNSNLPLPGSTASGEDEKALYQLENDWAQADLKKDAAALDKILANNFQANYENFVGNKQQLLADLKSGREKVESNVNSEMKAMVLGETAIVHGVAIAKSSTAGKDTSGQWRYTDVFVKRDGRWQCVTGYSARTK